MTFLRFPVTLKPCRTQTMPTASSTVSLSFKRSAWFHTKCFPLPAICTCNFSVGNTLAWASFFYPDCFLLSDCNSNLPTIGSSCSSLTPCCLAPSQQLCPSVAITIVCNTSLPPDSKLYECKDFSPYSISYAQSWRDVSHITGVQHIFAKLNKSISLSTHPRHADSGMESKTSSFNWSNLIQ